MVFCMVALLLPENLWAQTATATVDGTKLTITTTDPGQVTAAVSGLSTVQKAEITEIVLKGKFNEADLQSIQTSGNDFKATSVDMSEAQFERILSGEGAQNPQRWVKEETYTSLGSGVHAYVGGDLYQYSIHKSWSLTEDRPGNETIYETYGLMGAAASGSSVGSYAKIPVYKYCQMTYSSTGSTWVRIANGDYQNAEENLSWRDDDVSSGNNLTNIYDSDFLGNYDDGKIIIVRVFYQKVDGHWDYTKLYNPSDYAQAPEKFDGDAWNADEDALDDQYGADGSYIFFRHYYRKSTPRSWTDNTPDVTVAPENVTIVNGNFAYDDRNNYMDYADGTWVKMTTGEYTYYKLLSEDHGSWTDVTGSYVFMEQNIIGRYVNSENLPTNNDANDMKYAIVGGTEKVFDGTSWHDAGASETVADYSQMKFSYWSSTLKTAKTSKYADSNISSEIFQNCKSITHIDFLGGHVKGLNSRSCTPGENKYADFTLFVGKDVTEIEDGALNQSSALTGLEFDRNYEGMTSEELKNYPKELTIGNDAFNDCYNVFEIVIPNRCVSIGNAAFKHVGNGADAGNTFTPNEHQDQVLELTFERRNSADDNGVGINCDFPLTIGESAFMDCWYLKDLSLPIRLERMGKDCFRNTLSLKTLQMREESSPSSTYLGPRLRTIPTGAFFDSAIEELKIPQCVTLIEDGAFGDTEHLKKVTFQTNKESTESLPNNTLVIKSGAFTKGKEEGRPQLDVYVMVNPNERKSVCEYEAFNFTQTVGQTSTSTVNPSFAYLHFPEEYWDYYQGNWKRGLAFLQSNLNAMKDGYWNNNLDPDCVGKAADKASIDTTTGKYETGDANTQYAPANGWQEFARTSTSIDIEIPAANFIRTYSTKTVQVVPTYAEDINIGGVQHRRGEPLFKIYRIVNFTDGYVENTSTDAPASGVSPKATAKEVVLSFGENENSRRYIPKETGLIMASGANNVGVLVYMSTISLENSEKYPFDDSNPTDVPDDDNKVNLLYPTCAGPVTDGVTQNLTDDDYKEGAPRVLTVDGEQMVKLNPTIPYPYNKKSHPVQFRIFGLSSQDGQKGQFRRIGAGATMSRDKAYLKLKPSLFHYTAESSSAATEASSSGVDPVTGEPVSASQGAAIMMFFDEDGTTTIRKIDLNTMTVMEDCYYTLQGVKLNTRPTQPGIYIHNGKKVVIK